MFSIIKNKIKAIKKWIFFTGFFCLFFGLIIPVVHQKSQYLADRNIFILGLIFSGVGIICITLSRIRREKFSFFLVFLTIWFVKASFVLALTLFYSAYLDRLMLGLWITSLFAFGILFINETANRLLFGINDRKKQKTIYNEDASLDIGKEKIGQGDDFIEMAPTVDTISSEFAVDVLSVTLYLGAIFATFAYLFFIPNKDNLLFLGGIDIKTVALATAGLVTFFWAAKAAKNKSIELEEKKQDGKRRDKEIKMAEARDTAQLIAKASELLGSESDAQKNAGLAFLNRVASQKGGPLQKEAFDLLADFILSASDTTTANKPRMRAIIYIDNLLDDSCRHFWIDEFIVISASDGAEPNDAINDLDSLRIKNLYVTYIGLKFGSRAIHWATHSIIPYRFCFINCGLNGGKINEPPEIIENISAFSCYIINCKIVNVVKVNQSLPKNFSTGKHEFITDRTKIDLPDNGDYANCFSECDFSGSRGWTEICYGVMAGQEKDRFDRCYYYARHAPYGFDKKSDGELLIKISSRRQFNKLFKNLPWMKYSPPDDETSNV